MKPGDNLKPALDRLSEAAGKVLETRGYARDVKVVRALEELIREQIAHAHTRSATRTIR